MTSPENHIPVAIIGGGPVGLFLAICLLKKGINCRVLEKRKNPIADSRSLGIHPVSLELFDKVDITTSFLEHGLKIRKGIALTENKTLGKISFERCPKPHNYILACPQFTTESILRNELNKLDSNVLVTGAEFQQFNQDQNRVEINYTSDHENSHLTADFIVGCDGKNSLVRQQASIHYSGKHYNDTYIMGDFEDTTEFGPDAAVFLPKDGLIECFPLPNGMRRWVVKTDSYISNPTPLLLIKLVLDRIGYNLASAKNTMLSSFGVQHFMAETFAKKRVFLAGDSAHVVSPIGGQGMNLGWLDAWELSKTFSTRHTDVYNQKQQKIAKKVALRAEINMILGRKQAIPFLRNIFIRGMLKSPIQTKVAKKFTMRGLEKQWI
ncbi:MAG: FAD-dependent monooxygenase [Gracilimonas sp.]|uniref:FAD-dependent oxidoreductase n=1 Tax=Gracilimonas sp. TaxID=1974203 RepID=UPI0019B91A6C|nr:NAD(P)/FAD-dependent oxidoreductase [Gracilimonas sp.]MBD3617600.1 FAD-dependent monooxygenase [Gracilimonas sp.]